MKRYKEGINYYAVCKICFERDLKEDMPDKDIHRKVYIGETHRSLYTRRLTQLAKMNSNWMYHHNMECHKEESKEWSIEQNKNQFEFYPIKGYQKVLERQVAEYENINKAESEGSIYCGRRKINIDKNLLNTKFEYFGTKGYRIES